MSEQRAPTILTVEDEFFISDYLSDVLEQAGYTVIATRNADEAIAVLEARNDIRLIITDINMPGSMDGLKLAAAVRGRWPPIKIIIATGKGPPAREQMPCGSVFVPKPYRAGSIVATVQRLL
jgi:DNA-binding NtrC family response regulator